MMKKYILYILLALCAVSHGASAQVTTQGTDFYVAWGSKGAPPQSFMNPIITVFRLSQQIRIAATQNSTVTLTFKANNTTVTFNVLAGQVYTYNLDSTQITNVYSWVTGISDKSLYIHSTTPVSVYALSQLTASTDATNVLPVSNYGTDYYHLSYKSLKQYVEETGGTSIYEDGYTVIATEDGTNIYENGVLMATLNTGQVYSAYYPDADATGRHITSNHPIAYYVTNTCVNIPVGTAACDCLYQQLPPVNMWGNTFLVPVTRRGKERVRILASQNGTQVTQTGGTKNTDGGGGAYNPPNQNSFTLNAGQYAEFEIDLTGGGMYISADRPVAVASYLIGMDYSALTVAKGDPVMAWVPSVEQMIEGVAITPFVPSVNTQMDEHHALIVTPTATLSQTTVSIGGATATQLAGGTWRTGNGAGNAYSFYSLPLTNASSSYYFHNPNKLAVMGYGLGNYESYYYLAGAAARNLDAAFYINDVHYQDIDGSVFCGQQSFDFRAVIQYPLSSASGHLTWYINGTEETAARDILQWNKVLAPGNYTIEMRVIAAGNQTQTISTNISVNPQATAANVTTADAVACLNATATLVGSSTGVTGVAIYRWYASQAAVTPLHTGATYTTPALTATTTYYVSVEGNNFCENASGNRKAVMVTVSGSLTPGAIGAAQTICYNTVPQPLTETATPACGCGSYAYQWQSSADNSTWIDISDATSVDYSPPALTASAYYRRAVSSGSCGTVYTSSVLVTVYPALNPGSAAGSPTTACYNSVVLLVNGSAPTGGTGTYTYQWQRSTDSITWTNAGTSIAFSVWLTESTYFRRGVISGPCGPVYAEPVFIRIHPLPTVNAVADTTVCTGTIVPQKTFSSPTAGVTFSWTNDNTAIGLAASGTGNLPQFTAQSDSPYSITATITVTPTINSCAGTPITYNIMVSPCAVPVNPHLRSGVVY
ncbi:MAG: hypothetical protein LBJ58_06425 [Tannerellaceae bacterium]|jgi:hypothetical protein|nr:hypothetical protein [Tannerellaceae bacterium]